MILSSWLVSPQDGDLEVSNKLDIPPESNLIRSDWHTTVGKMHPTCSEHTQLKSNEHGKMFLYTLKNTPGSIYHALK